MIVFPNAKINLGLRVLRKREDGFHDIESLFVPIPLKDALECISRPWTSGCSLQIHGIAINGKPEDNLVVRAYNLLKKDFPDLPGVEFHLLKAIPTGAGLGGGSSNAAFALKLLNDKYSLELAEEQLLKYALELGSDCPFFIQNYSAIGKGRGEDLQPIDLPLPYHILIVYPPIHISTGWAFSAIRPDEGGLSIAEAIAKPIEQWKDVLRNDFEKPVFLSHPSIKDIKDKMYEEGALYSTLSGSGSTVVGLFAKKKEIPFPSSYFMKWLEPGLAP